MTLVATPARILVVDDDAGMLRAVSRVLGRHHDVTALVSPGAALEQVTALAPDIAIVDIRMPEIDGFELMQRLLAKQPDLDVILMTGNAVEPEAHLIRAIEAGAFYFIQKPFDRRVLLTLVDRCLQLRRLQKERQRHLDRLERELNEARRFQDSMLPAPSCTIEGVCLDARYEACTELAGDFYDYARAPDGRVAFVIADVSGHGASAAMLTGIVKSAFHASVDDAYEPLRFVERVSEGLRSFDGCRFVTLFAGRVDPTAQSLIFASAGHPTAILRRADRTVELLESTGPLISPIFRSVPFEQETIALGTGDQLLVYTDGVVEAAGPAGAFGHARVQQVVERSAHGGEALIDDLLEQLAEFTNRRPRDDDVTVLCVGT
ncbi:MAG: SpoIIE family protein phosphatase [Planctomycetes bacterium]|nr:SpoIIE family protein phosphatase [Planctomycetota bacterium]